MFLCQGHGGLDDECAWLSGTKKEMFLVSLRSETSCPNNTLRTDDMLTSCLLSRKKPKRPHMLDNTVKSQRPPAVLPGWMRSRGTWKAVSLSMRISQMIIINQQCADDHHSESITAFNVSRITHHAHRASHSLGVVLQELHLLFEGAGSAGLRLAQGVPLSNGFGECAM